MISTFKEIELPKGIDLLSIIIWHSYTGDSLEKKLSHFSKDNSSFSSY